MGIITQTFLSEDGACRAVIVKTKAGLIKRSVNNLHQLECSNVRNLNESSDLNVPNSYHVRIGTLNENMNVPNDLTHISECSNIQDLEEDTVEASGESEELLQGCQGPEKTSQKESSKLKYSRRGRKIKAPDKLNL